MGDDELKRLPSSQDIWKTSGTQREYSLKPLKHVKYSIVERILVFKR